MQLTYFGCLCVTMDFLPSIVTPKKGHVVTISSIGVLTNAPRFSAYVALKAVLNAWTCCVSSELSDQGMSFITINIPLVRSPMIAPTGLYNNAPTRSPGRGGRHDCPSLHFQAGSHLHAPGHDRADFARHPPMRGRDYCEQQFQDVRGLGRRQAAKPVKQQLSPEAMAMQQMMRGIHF